MFWSDFLRGQQTILGMPPLAYFQSRNQYAPKVTPTRCHCSCRNQAALREHFDVIGINAKAQRGQAAKLKNEKQRRTLHLPSSDSRDCELKRAHLDTDPRRCLAGVSRLTVLGAEKLPNRLKTELRPVLDTHSLQQSWWI